MKRGRENETLNPAVQVSPFCVCVWLGQLLFALKAFDLGFLQLKES